MGVKAKFKMKDVRAYIAQRVQAYNEEVVNRFIAIGKEAMYNMHANKGYNNDTGNLESSTGFCVLLNGVTMHQEFEEATEGTDKTTGVQTGIEFIETLKGEFTRGPAFIMVAGMGYAAAVESKGRDVLSGTIETIVIAKLDQLFRT